VRLWDVKAAGPAARAYTGCSAPVTSLAVCAGGDVVAAGTSTGKIHLWDAVTAKTLAVLQGHEGQVNSLSFDPRFDGGDLRLVSGGADCTLRSWSVPANALAQGMRVRVYMCVYELYILSLIARLRSRLFSSRLFSQF
jgi:WD40 repeat protein